MKWNIALVVAVLVSASSTVTAQRGDSARLDRGGAQRTLGRQPGEPPLSYSLHSHWNPDYPDYGEYWNISRYMDYAYLPAPVVAVVMQVPQTPVPVSPAPSPPPPAPVLHEYSWSDPGGDGGTAFAIVAKDGTLQLAIAV